MNVEVADLDSRTEANQAKTSKLLEDTEALVKATAEGRIVEDKRKEAAKKAVEEADFECKEVEGLRQSIADLNATREKNTNELNQMAEKKGADLSMLQEDIDNTLFKLKSVEERTKEAETQQEASRAEYSKELNKAKEVKDMIQTAFKRAQERVSDFEVQPDDELAAEMKQLDDDEQAIINDADIERDDIIGRECISPRVD